MGVFFALDRSERVGGSDRHLGSARVWPLAVWPLAGWPLAVWPLAVWHLSVWYKTSEGLCARMAPWPRGAITRHACRKEYHGLASYSCSVVSESGPALCRCCVQLRS